MNKFLILKSLTKTEIKIGQKKKNDSILNSQRSFNFSFCFHISNSTVNQTKSFQEIFFIE